MTGIRRLGRKNEYLSFAHSQQGASHLLTGTVCQDHSLISGGRDLIFAAVCDGHGGSDYVRSDRGSRLAAQAALECVSDSALLSALRRSRSERETERLIQQLKRSIIGLWLRLIGEDFDNEPFSEDELAWVSDAAREEYLAGNIAPAYGSTLVFSLTAKDLWLVMQLGDGNCAVMLDDGSITEPLPPDPLCRMNITTSMCDSEAAAEMRHCLGTEPPAAVFLSTDGIENSFSGKEQLYAFYRTAASAFSSGDIAEAEAQLLDYLPRLSEKGSGDDVSFAFVLDRDKVKEIAEKASDN